MKTGGRSIISFDRITLWDTEPPYQRLAYAIFIQLVKFWADNTGTELCNVNITGMISHGYIQSRNVVVVVISDIENIFKVTSKHNIVIEYLLLTTGKISIGMIKT